MNGACCFSNYGSIHQESLRKYSVVPMVVRRVVGHIDLGEAQLDDGFTLIINILALHHSPALWPNPMKFDPHRFLNKTPQPYAFLPFIEGPRNCLGQHLALLESKIVMSLLAQRYEFSVDSSVGTEFGDADDPRHRYVVPVIPKAGIRVKIRRRDDQSPKEQVAK